MDAFLCSGFHIETETSATRARYGFGAFPATETRDSRRQQPLVCVEMCMCRRPIPMSFPVSNKPYWTFWSPNYLTPIAHAELLFHPRGEALSLIPARWNKPSITFSYFDLFLNPRYLKKAGFSDMKEMIRSRTLALYHIIIPSSKDVQFEFKDEEVGDSDEEYTNSQNKSYPFFVSTSPQKHIIDF